MLEKYRLHSFKGAECQANQTLDTFQQGGYTVFPAAPHTYASPHALNPAIPEEEQNVNRRHLLDYGPGPLDGRGDDLYVNPIHRTVWKALESGELGRIRALAEDPDLYRQVVMWCRAYYDPEYARHMDLQFGIIAMSTSAIVRGVQNAIPSIKGLLKNHGLPTTGKVRFVPPKGHHPSNPLPRGPNKGFIDRFGNEWVKGPSRTKGQPYEWDVQLSKTGRSQLGRVSSDGKHLNVSLDGRITH